MGESAIPNIVATSDKQDIPVVRLPTSCQQEILVMPYVNNNNTINKLSGPAVDLTGTSDSLYKSVTKMGDIFRGNNIENVPLILRQ